MRATKLRFRLDFYCFNFRSAVPRPLGPFVAALGFVLASPGRAMLAFALGGSSSQKSRVALLAAISGSPDRCALPNCAFASIFTVLIFVRPFHDLLVPSSPHSALFSHRPAGQCSLSRSAAPLPKNLASLCSLRFPGALIDARYQTALSPRFCNYKIALGRSTETAYTIIHFFP